MTVTKISALGAINMALAVALGALGAHFLKEKLDAHLLQVFEKAVKYHLIHAIALVALPLLLKDLPGAHRVWHMQLAGILLFSGSLYILSTRFLLGIDNWKWLGMITPLGGILFIGSWLWLGILLWRRS